MSETDINKKLEDLNVNDEKTSNTTNTIDTDKNNTEKEQNETNSATTTNDEKESDTNDETKKEVIIEKKIIKADKEEVEKANSLKVQGNTLYGSGEYQEAIDAYTKAIEMLVRPKKIVEIIEEGEKDDRALCNEEVAVYYSNRAASHLALKQYESVIEDCTEALDLEPSKPIQLKAKSRRAQAYEATDKLNEAFDDFKACLAIDPKFQLALQAALRLPLKIKAKEEREREEMMGKLKDLGNTILGKFGLSTDNFQFIKDPNTGGYSVNFNKK